MEWSQRLGNPGLGSHCTANFEITHPVSHLRGSSALHMYASNLEDADTSVTHIKHGIYLLWPRIHYNNCSHVGESLAIVCGKNFLIDKKF